jgi:ATP-dependent RNA helicase DDX55/SPB4
VCKSFGLLRIPKVPELKSVDTSAFPESRDIEVKLSYKDRSREKQRMANKIAAATEDQVDRENKSKKRRPVQTESWSVQKRIKSKRAENQKKSTIRKMAKATKKVNEKLSNSSKSKDWKDQVLLSK